MEPKGELMNLSAEGIYRSKTSTVPRYTQEEERAFFVQRESHYHSLVYALCQESLGTKFLMKHECTRAADSKSHLVPVFERYEQKLRKSGGKNGENVEKVFRLCYDAGLPHYLIVRAMQDVLADSKEPQSHKKARKTLLALKQEEKIFFNSHAYLVKALARRFEWTGTPLMDRIQDGNMGLLRAIDKYDCRQNYSFGNYAGWQIRRNITLGIPDQTQSFPLTQKNRAALKKILEAQTVLQEKLQCEPTIKEIAEEVKMVPFYVQAYLMEGGRKGSRMVSLDAPSGERSDSYFLLETEEYQVDTTSLEQKLLVEQIEKYIGTLNPREQMVIRLRFGESTLTQKEIGIELDGLSHQFISRLEAKIFAKLKKKIETDPFRVEF